MSFSLDTLEAAPSAADYVASLVPPQGSLSELEDSLSRLVSHLELASSDASSSISTLVSSLDRTVPSVSFDLQLLREHALMLRFAMQSASSRSDSSNSIPSAALTDSNSNFALRLSSLFTIQKHLSDSLDILRQADTWTSLDTDVAALLVAGYFAKAASRLADASDTLSLFSNTSEYEPRRVLLVSLQNSLEAHLVSGLVHSITQRDTPNIRAVGDILREAGREEEFHGYYFGARRSDVVTSWKNARILDCTSSSEDDSENERKLPPSPVSLPHFSVWFPSWIGSVLQLVSDEVSLLPAIFPNAFDTFSAFLSSTFDSLYPSIPQRLSDVATHHGSRVLPEFIKLYHSAEELALATDRLSQKLKPTSPGNGLSASTLSLEESSSSPPDATATPKRRMSKRLSISRRLSSRSLSFSHQHSSADSESAANDPSTSYTVPSSTSSDEPIPAWEFALLEPFLEWQVEYSELEARLLEDALLPHLSSLETQNSFDPLISGGTKYIWEISVTLFSLADDALGRCMAFTHGYGAAAYVEAVDEMLLKFFKKCKDVFVDQRSKSVSSSNSITKNTTRQSNSLYLSEQDDSLGIDTSSFSLEGFDYSSEDWTSFRLGLRLLRTCRSINEKLHSLEGRAKTRLSIVAQVIRDGVIVPGTTRGALYLLQQSTLNSLELRHVLDIVSPLPPSEDADSRSKSSTPSQHHQQQQSTSSLALPTSSTRYQRRRSSNTTGTSSTQAQQQQAARERIVFERAKRGIHEFAQSCQEMVHKTIMRPLISSLHGYESLSVWRNAPSSNTSNNSSTTNGGASFNLSIPTFSLSPTEHISRLSEGLFNLPRLFEIYASDEDSLSFLIESLPFFNADPSRNQPQEISPLTNSINAFGLSSESKDPKDVKDANGELSSSSKARRRHSLLAGSAMAPTTETTTTKSINTSTSPSPSATSQTASMSTEQIISSWLSSLTLTAIDNLLQVHVSKISTLTEKGARQLLCDLSHVANVAKALEVESVALQYWSAALDNIINTRLSQQQQQKSNSNFSNITSPTSTPSHNSGVSTPADANDMTLLDSWDSGSADSVEAQRIWSQVSKMVK